MDYCGVALDRADGPSLYLQLAQALASTVARGGLALGERLPSERELAGILGVSRTTVVAAYRELEARGFACGHLGRSMFVVGEASLALLPAEGHPPLREAIAARHGTGLEEVLVVSGAQQGLDLVARCLVDPGDAVVMDRPGYLGAGEHRIRPCYAVLPRGGHRTGRWPPRGVLRGKDRRSVSSSRRVVTAVGVRTPGVMIGWDTPYPSLSPSTPNVRWFADTP